LLISVSPCPGRDFISDMTFRVNRCFGGLHLFSSYNFLRAA
jgi:hypothetical protein